MTYILYVISLISIYDDITQKPCIQWYSVLLWFANINQNKVSNLTSLKTSLCDKHCSVVDVRLSKQNR